MSGAAAVIIGGGTNLRTTMAKGFVYPMAQGDGVQNEGDANVELRFTPTSTGVAGDFWLAPTAVMGFMEPGTLELL